VIEVQKMACRKSRGSSLDLDTGTWCLAINVQMTRRPGAGGGQSAGQRSETISTHARFCEVAYERR
jgi:hypothetical protein